MSKFVAAIRAALPFAIGFPLAACIIQEPPPQHPQEQADAPSEASDPAAGELPEGDYACSIDSGYQYPPFRCVVYTADDGTRMLEKLGGSQRLRARVAPSAAGFWFDGEFFCSEGACDEAVSGEFVAVGNQSYRAELPSQYGGTTIVLTYMPGGFTDGGARYGGAPAPGEPQPSAPEPVSPPPES